MNKSRDGEQTQRKDVVGGYLHDRAWPHQPVHGIVVGHTWIKRVRYSKHLRRRPFPGWAFDIVDVRAAQRCGVQWVEVRDCEQGVVYRASLHSVIAKGTPFDYGSGVQICVPLTLWHVPNRGDKTPPSTPTTQLRLW